MANDCAFEGSGRKLESPENSSVPDDGRQPLNLEMLSSSRTITILAQVEPTLWQSDPVAHSSTQIPSWQVPRSQSPSAAQAAPDAPVPRRATQAGRICVVGVGSFWPTAFRPQVWPVGQALSRLQLCTHAPSRHSRDEQSVSITHFAPSAAPS